MKTTTFVCLVNLGPNSMEQIHLFVSNRHEVYSFGLERIDCTSIDKMKSKENEVTELFSLNLIFLGEKICLHS